jgi:copper resistance protein C
MLKKQAMLEKQAVRTLIAILSLAFVALGAPAARAHAFLDHASPLVGSTVDAAPHEVALTFTQSLEPAFSSVTVTDASGAEVSQGKAEVSGNTMRVGIKASGPGTYRVRWHALSVDTHSTEGSFTFHVGGK